MFLGERIGINKLVSLALGMGGLAVLLLSDGSEYLTRPAGFIVMLGAAVSWAAGTVLLKARDWPPTALARSAWLVGISAIPAAIGALLEEAGMTRANLLSLRFFTTDIDGFLGAYDAYVEWIAPSGTMPPQSLLGVNRLAFPELLVEIEAVAGA